LHVCANCRCLRTHAKSIVAIVDEERAGKAEIEGEGEDGEHRK
jgi:hypothetical protein